MEMRQLEAFVTLVECQSFSLAAKQLHLSQPTISAHLRILEQELQTRLILRSTRSFALTQSGEKLYRYALRMLDIHRRACADIAGGGQEELTIGTSSVPGRWLLPEALVRFRKLFPQVHMHIVSSDSVDVIASVLDRQLDVGLVGTKADAPCAFEPIAVDDLAVVTPCTPHYQAMAKRGATWRELLREPYLMRSGHSGTRQEVERILSAQGITPNALHVVATIDDAEILLRCIEQGVGISILSSHLAEGLAKQGRVLVFPVREPDARRNLYLVYLEDALMPKALAAFLQTVMSINHADKPDAALPGLPMQGGKVPVGHKP